MSNDHSNPNDQMTNGKLPKVIYVMGPPWAGKGTQAELLAQKIGYHRFSTGDAFRAISRQDTELGRKVKETIDNGYLAPPEMAAEVVIEAVTGYVDDKTGLVFDGTPRTVKEAELVDEFFAEHGYGRPLAILLKVDKEVMIERNSKRKFCLDIDPVRGHLVAEGGTASAASGRPASNGVDSDFPIVAPEDEKRCIEVGGRIGIRPDDEPGKFETRWNEFMNQTYPVAMEYKTEGILKEVDGTASIEDVHTQVMEIINSYD